MDPHVSAVIENRVIVRFFHGLLRQERQVIVVKADCRRFSREKTLVRQGDPADRLFLLIKGSARFYFITPGGRTVYLHWLAPGEIFGGASLLQDVTSFLVSTEVSKGSHVLVWRRDVIRGLANVYPRLLENALSVASDYLTWYLASHLSLVCYSAQERLAHVLVSLADGIGHKCSRGIRLDVTNEQLANTANITPFTASRLLRGFQLSGAISKSRGRILIQRPERLFSNSQAH